METLMIWRFVSISKLKKLRQVKSVAKTRENIIHFPQRVLPYM